MVQRADSGVAVDVNGSVDHAAFVTNPGYVTPIQTSPTTSSRAARSDGIRSTARILP